MLRTLLLTVVVLAAGCGGPQKETQKSETAGALSGPTISQVRVTVTARVVDKAGTPIPKAVGYVKLANKEEFTKTGKNGFFQQTVIYTTTQSPLFSQPLTVCVKPVGLKKKCRQTSANNNSSKQFKFVY